MTVVQYFQFRGGMETIQMFFVNFADNITIPSHKCIQSIKLSHCQNNGYLSIIEIYIILTDFGAELHCKKICGKRKNTAVFFAASVFFLSVSGL